MANIDDQPLPLKDRVVVPCPLGDVRASHRSQVHVTDLALPRFLDRQPTGVFPLVIAEIGGPAGGDRFDDDAARGLGSRIANRTQHLSTRLVSQQHIDVIDRKRGNAVDRFDHRARLHLDTRLGQGRDLVGKIRIGSVNVFDNVATPVSVPPEHRTQLADRYAVIGVTVISSADVDVQGLEFPDHLGDQVVELGPVGHPVHQRQVPFEHFLPVDAVEVGVVEVISLHPPRIDEHLPPLGRRIYGHPPTRETDAGLAQRLRRGSRCVEDMQVVVLVCQHLLAIARHAERLDIGQHRGRLGFRIATNGLQGPRAFLRRGSRDKVQVLVGGRQGRVVAGRDRDQGNPGGDTIEINPQRLRVRFLRLALGGLRPILPQVLFRLERRPLFLDE